MFSKTDRRVNRLLTWKLRLRPVGSDRVVDAIAFNAVERLPVVPARIHAAYQLDRNEWQGQVRLQLRVVYMDGAEA